MELDYDEEDLRREEVSNTPPPMQKKKKATQKEWEKSPTCLNPTYAGSDLHLLILNCRVSDKLSTINLCTKPIPCDRAFKSTDQTRHCTDDHDTQAVDEAPH